MPRTLHPPFTPRRGPHPPGRRAVTIQTESKATAEPTALTLHMNTLGPARQLSLKPTCASTSAGTRSSRASRKLPAVGHLRPSPTVCFVLRDRQPGIRGTLTISAPPKMQLVAGHSHRCPDSVCPVLTGSNVPADAASAVIERLYRASAADGHGRIRRLHAVLAQLCNPPPRQHVTTERLRIMISIAARLKYEQENNRTIL